MQKWYYLVDDGEVIGPFADIEMIELYTGEKIHSETYVWNEHLDEWLYFRDSPLFNEEWKENEPEPEHQKIREASSRISFRELFSEVPKKHAGGNSERESSLPRPWIFSRVLLVMMLTAAALFSMAYLFYLPQFLPGILIVSAFSIPFALVVFFWEIISPKNVHLYDLGQMFFIGSLVALVLMQILYNLFPLGEWRIPGAILIAIIMTLGKLALIAVFLHRLNTRYYVNGLLIGATIGAAFAIFESLGHAFHAYASGGYGEILDTLALHGWSAAGSHTIWGSLIGGALAFVKRNDSLKKNHFTDPGFLKLLTIPVVLHAAWNISLLTDYYVLLLIALSVIVWVFIFRGIQRDLGEKQREVES
ncbi:DUF4339 domain-containing protein [Salicibibacter cibarius]|uniref:DUF4339 domain-containing protein n=1 Tax=Salicibibacter cibarius TaxID=2743000 RepID=A0A7T6Z4I0_9BACI|nr:PrsW family glutamic-type intramembrane protease [Salicibibacter cibarius]QQK76845.1 DUF4339 domain-containing protein [Salicibibacter cibarius]